MYGNMSSHEKSLNKNDLNAYKNFDSRQFSLVPGLQHSKHLIDGDQLSISLSPKGYQNKKHLDSNEKYNMKQNQLRSLGFNDKIGNLNSN